jgi:glycogen debranching enzyme
MAQGAGIEDLVVLKEAALFLLARPDGDIGPCSAVGEGLYWNDTRYLSELTLRIGGVAPLLRSSKVQSAYKADAELTNDVTTDLPPETLSVHKSILLGDRLYQRLEIRNQSDARLATDVEVSLAADFADMFEVRAVYESDVFRSISVCIGEHRLCFSYLGRDGVRRETLTEVAPGNGAEIHKGGLFWPLILEAGGCVELELTVEASVDGSRSPRLSFERALERTGSNTAGWRESWSRVACDSEDVGRVLETSLNDVVALLTPSEDGDMIAAGMPWYVASFGRDALITSLEMLSMSSEPARLTLRHLARLQATSDDAFRDSEPGKILHERRRGELALTGSIPHSPYYGTVDATALFVMLAAAYWRWTADLELIGELEPALAKALAWIDDYGDRDGDGFVEYERRSPLGLRNQGWKDSENSIVHADGSLAQGPIALVEVQAYVYAAKRGMAELCRTLGDRKRAASLDTEAARLRDAFNDAFWMPAEDTFALALDGGKRQVQSVASNAGHCLYCGITEGGRAEAVADRLLAGDMFSGWGIRTLSSRAVAYDPGSYHNGSIWPHDNAIITAGFKSCALSNQADRVASAMFEAALTADDARLPELFCGYDRKKDAGYGRYPVACRPQAWSGAAPLMLLQAMLGISPNAPAGSLYIHRPSLPLDASRLRISEMRVGETPVDLEVTRAEELTECRVFNAGDLHVSIET